MAAGQTIDIDKAKEVILALKALTTTRPHEVIKIIGQAGENGINVGGICSKTKNLSQANASILLARLRKLNLVQKRRDSQLVYYSLNKDVFIRLSAVIAAFK